VVAGFSSIALLVVVVNKLLLKVYYTAMSLKSFFYPLNVNLTKAFICFSFFSHSCSR